MAGTAHGGPIGVPPKVMKGEDLHHHALEQLPHLAYCINDNPRWGKQESCSFQYSLLWLMLLLPSLLFLLFADSRCYCYFWICVSVFQPLTFYAFGSDDSAAEAIVLGFQHYITMLGTTVLIPTLIFRNIGGNAVRSSS